MKGVRGGEEGEHERAVRDIGERERGREGKKGEKRVLKRGSVGRG